VLPVLCMGERKALRETCPLHPCCCCGQWLRPSVPISIRIAWSLLCLHLCLRGCTAPGRYERTVALTNDTAQRWERRQARTDDSGMPLPARAENTASPFPSILPRTAAQQRVPFRFMPTSAFLPSATALCLPDVGFVPLLLLFRLACLLSRTSCHGFLYMRFSSRRIHSAVASYLYGSASWRGLPSCYYLCAPVRAVSAV